MSHDLNPDLVTEDPMLTPAEKETSFWFAKPDDRVTVFTAEASLVRCLLSHPAFEVAHATHRGDSLVDVNGSLPIGYLSVGSTPRQSASHAEVVLSQVLRDYNGARRVDGDAAVNQLD